jgi:hypothetical protein
MAINRKMEVVITAKDKTKTGTKSATSNLDKVAGAAKGVAIAAAAAGVALGTAVVARSLKAWAVQEQAILQVEKRLKSTGAAAWTSSRQLQSMAAGFQKMTVFGDEAVLQMQSLLLTFKDIRGPVFERTTGAILDMASALAQSTGGEPDLRSAATMVGKALQDPVLGLTAMSRAGIQFSDTQKEVIKNLVETNQKAEAQTIILKELESQFGGAAGAVGLSGATKQTMNAFGDLFEEFGKGLTATGNLEGSLRGLTDYMGAPDTKAAITEFGSDISAIGGFLLETEMIAWKIVKNNPLALIWEAAGAAMEAPKQALEALTGGGAGPVPQLGGIAGPVSMAQVAAGQGGPGFSALTLGGIGGQVGMAAPGTIGAESPQAAARRAEHDAYLANLQAEGEAFSLSLMTQEEQLTVSYENRQAKLIELEENKIITHQTYLEMQKGLEEAHSDDLVKIKAREARQKERIARRHSDVVLSFANNLGQAISAGSDKTNRKSFERDKKMNIGLAVVNTAVGATRAFKDYSWPWSAVAAAAVIASGAAQISTIKSQQFGGEGSTTAPAGGAIIPTTQPEAVAQPTAATETSAAPIYNIQVMGNIIDNDQFARDLITPLEQARQDGVEAQLA